MTHELAMTHDLAWQIVVGDLWWLLRWPLLISLWLLVGSWRDSAREWVLFFLLVLSVFVTVVVANS